MFLMVKVIIIVTCEEQLKKKRSLDNGITK